MKILEGKKGLIIGVANNRSIAWGIAQSARNHGAELAFTYLNEALEKRVTPLAESVGSNIVLPCDVQKDEDIDKVVADLQDRWGTVDFVVHSVAYAQAEDLKERFSQTSRAGFSLALDISAYSLVAVAQRIRHIMPRGSNILTLSYLGAVQVVPRYRLMGVAKAALEACVRELAVDLGEDGIRVNAVSAGPIKTLAASGIADFRQLVGAFEIRAPLKTIVTIEEVGDSSVYLLSDMARAVTGEVHYVDCGFNVTTA